MLPWGFLVTLGTRIHFFHVAFWFWTYRPKPWWDRCQETLLGGVPTPLKNDGVRQLGSWHSQYDGKNKKMFQRTNRWVKFECGSKTNCPNLDATLIEEDQEARAARVHQILTQYHAVSWPTRPCYSSFKWNSSSGHARIRKLEPRIRKLTGTRIRKLRFGN